MKTLLLILVLAFAAVGAFGQKAICSANSPEVKAQRSQFATLDASFKVAIWTDSLNHQLSTRSLTQEQRALISEALAMVEADPYTHPLSIKSMAPFKARLLANFSLKDGAEIFERIDPDVWSKFTATNYVAPAIIKPVGDCSCSTTWTFCGSEGSCNLPTGQFRCIEVIDCGPFWGFSCNGTCYPHY